MSAAIEVAVTEQFLTESTVAVHLGGLKAYFELDLASSAGVSESIELIASEKLSLAVGPSQLQSHRRETSANKPSRFPISSMSTTPQLSPLTSS